MLMLRKEICYLKASISDDPPRLLEREGPNEKQARSKAFGRKFSILVGSTSDKLWEAIQAEM